jgi:hypothetical protein
LGNLKNIVVGGRISFSSFDQYVAATVAAARKNTPYLHYQDIAENTKFILNHFQKPLFPRTISTFRTNGKQIRIYSFEEIICEFKKARYVDCKINSFS